MTQASRVLDYLWSIAPGGATNTEIGRQAGISSHQTVYMLTQQLIRRGLVRGEQDGRTWTFYAEEVLDGLLPSNSSAESPMLRTVHAGPLTFNQFEAFARTVMSERFGVRLPQGAVQGVRKKFDFVSTDQMIVGDAKYFTLVGGVGLPPAKFSVIAEHVWLLEKTNARTQFLIFGNDRAVPVRWLERYGRLASTVDFYFLTDDGTLDVLHQAKSS
jgi:hypothetical protein